MTVISQAKKLFISVTSFPEVKIRPPAAYRLQYNIAHFNGEVNLN
jgi:hypothetical protein